MLSSIQASIQNFLEKYYPFIVICLITITVIYSVVNLTIKPPAWKDEALAIEGAYNLLRFGKLSILLGPDTFIENPLFAITSGPPLILPLSFFFKLFGFGIAQARWYMIIWLSVFLAVIAWLTKKLFTKSDSILALLLILTFTPMHVYGRTAVGELPGTLFIILSIYFIAVRRQYWLGGLLAGIGMIARPSEGLLLAPALLLYFLIRNIGIKNFMKLSLGIAPSMLLFIIFFFPNPLQLTTWQAASNFYQNPFGENLSRNIVPNIILFFTHPTLIYFSLFALAIGLAAYCRRQKAVTEFTLLSLLFVFFSVIYFVRSPGWFRYLFPAHIILLMLAPFSIHALCEKKKFRFGTLLVIAFIVIQAINFVYFPSLGSSNSLERMVTYLNRITPEDKKIFIINDPLLGAFIEPQKKYHIFQLTGVPVHGTNQLENAPKDLPYIIIYRNYIPENKQFLEPHQDILATQYHTIDNLGQGGYTVLQRNF